MIITKNIDGETLTFTLEASTVQKFWNQMGHTAKTL